MKRHMVFRGSMALTAACLAAGVAFADSTWTGNAGDNCLNTAGNWNNNTVPSGSNAYLLKDAGPLALSGDLTLQQIFFGDNSATPQITLDLGSSRTWKTTNRFFVKKNAVVTLKSGTLKSDGRVFVGDNYSCATLVVDGANAHLVGSSNTSGAYYVQVGSSNNGLSTDSLLKVQNGGSMFGWLVMGRLCYGTGTSAWGTNTVLVTGAGSTFTGNGDTIIGGEQGLCRFVADDQSQVVMRGKLRMGTYDVDGKSSEARAGVGNVVSVRNGASLVVSNEVFVGEQSCSNVFEVVSGGKATVIGMLSTSKSYGVGSGDARTALTSGVLPDHNIVRVSGEGAELTLSAGARIGRTEVAHDDAIEVLDGGKLTMRSASGFNSYYLGVNRGEYLGMNEGSAHNRILVDGGTLDASNGALELVVGCTTDSNAMIVTNNGQATVRNLYIGKTMGVNHASSNLVSVAAGGTLRALGDCIVGHWDNAGTTSVGEGNCLWVGPNGTFAHTISNGSSVTNYFVVGRGVLAQANRAIVEGVFTFTNAGSDQQAFVVGEASLSNRFEVVNGGTATLTKGGLTIGANSSAAGNAVRIGAGSTLSLKTTDAVFIGASGRDSSLIADGGHFDALGANKVLLGGYLRGEGASLVVRNGGVADIHRLIIGDKAPNSSLVVSNATLNLSLGGGDWSGYLQMGYSAVSAGVANPTNATVVVAGHDTVLNVRGGVLMRNASAKIKFAIPADGFAQTPLAIKGAFETVATGAAIEVTADPDWPVGSRVTLIEAGGAGQMANLKLVGDCFVKVSRVGNTIVAKRTGGLYLLLK